MSDAAIKKRQTSWYPAGDRFGDLEHPHGELDEELAEPTIRVGNHVDARAIADIASNYMLDRVDDPSNGWLRFTPSADEVAHAMSAAGSEYLIRYNRAGQVSSYARISPPTEMYHPPHEHKLFPEYRERIRAIFDSGAYYYKSTLAVHPDERGGTSALEKRIFEDYPGLPMFCHVAVFTGDDFHAWDGAPGTFAPAHNNLASHRFHQKHGWVPVGYLCDVPDCPFNTGMAAPTDGGACAILYAHFPEPSPAPSGFVDPVQAVLGCPVEPEDLVPPEPTRYEDVKEKMLPDPGLLYAARRPIDHALVRKVEEACRRWMKENDPWRFVPDDDDP